MHLPKSLDVLFWTSASSLPRVCSGRCHLHSAECAVSPLSPSAAQAWSSPAHPHRPPSGACCLLQVLGLQSGRWHRLLRTEHIPVCSHRPTVHVYRAAPTAAQTDTSGNQHSAAASALVQALRHCADHECCCPPSRACSKPTPLQCRHDGVWQMRAPSSAKATRFYLSFQRPGSLLSSTIMQAGHDQRPPELSAALQFLQPPLPSATALLLAITSAGHTMSAVSHVV